MAMVNTLWLATLTKDQRDAGTDTQRLNLTVNIDGEDLVDTHFYFSDLGRGRAELSGGPHGLPSEPLTVQLNRPFSQTPQSDWASEQMMLGPPGMSLYWAVQSGGLKRSQWRRRWIAG